MAPRRDPDYYTLLGLRADASDDAIRRAYRRLALRWHPDRNPGDPAAPERFREISAAYAVLVDPAKRRAYDEARRSGVTDTFRGRREDVFRDLFANAQASSIFEELAREFARQGMRVDRHHFQQTLFGGRAVVTGNLIVVTPFSPVVSLFRIARAVLQGGGLRAGSTRGGASAPSEMPLPRPDDLLARAVRAGRWLLGLPAAPPSVGPADLVLPLRLTRAEATRGGRKRVTLPGNVPREVLVTIPSGVRTGTRLRLRGKGGARPGHPPGDTYLEVEVLD